MEFKQKNSQRRVDQKTYSGIIIILFGVKSFFSLLDKLLNGSIPPLEDVSFSIFL